MTSIDNWAPWIAIIFAGGPIVLGMMSISFCLYLSRRHLDAMMDALANSRFMSLWGAGFRGNGWVGSFVLIVAIAGMVIWPRSYIRYGHLTLSDIENFPPRLKRLLFIYVLMVIVSLVWMSVVYVLVKYR